jgi:FSR family fosmidomycin resistance protein-like MFS transporter
MSLVFFLPYWAVKAGAGLGAGAFVSAFLFAGVIGTLAAGPLADKLGAQFVLLMSLIPVSPLLLGFLTLRGVPALLVVGICGALVISSFSLTVVMTQALMTRHQGMAAGLTNGFASGIGGLGVFVTGAMADHFGLATSLFFLALLPLPAALLAWRLPAISRGAASNVRHAMPAVASVG